MVDVQTICQKLKPLIGQKADRYWLAYLAEDTDGKKEIADTLQLLALKILGGELKNTMAHLSVPSKTTAQGEHPIGTVSYAGRSLYPFGLRESEWLQHIAIFGRSGAGKTNTVFLLINNLIRHKKPFLIFDWKRNYRDLLAGPNKNTLVYKSEVRSLLLHLTLSSPRKAWHRTSGSRN
jgi:DNA helicase HerA-like ATPase